MYWKDKFIILQFYKPMVGAGTCLVPNKKFRIIPHKNVVKLNSKKK